MAKINSIAARPAHLKDWDEVDICLRRLGEIDIAVSALEGAMTLEINTIKDGYDLKAEGLKFEKKALEIIITDYAENAKDEFLKTRSKVLTFGTVAYRMTTSIKPKLKAATMTCLKALGLGDYIRIKEELDLVKMLELDDATLTKVGAVRKKEDKLRIEPNLERLKEAA